MQRLWMIIFSLKLVTGLGYAQQTPSATDVEDASQKIVHPPALLNNVEAEFSEEARSKGISGLCLVALTIDSKGLPQDIRLLRCTDPVFAKNSLSTVSKYRFAPAAKADGTQVAVKITVEISFIRDDRPPVIPIGYQFMSPPGATSSSPDAAGVYPLTGALSAPVITSFVDEGYGESAFHLLGNGGCDTTLAIDKKGKPSDLETLHCEESSLEKPAAESLLKSHYKPASLNGKAVPVKVSVHLELGGFPSTQ
jgi:TonB family protein